MFFKRQNNGDNFLNEADKIIEKYEEEKAMEEKRITREEFDDAIKKTMESMMEDENIEGMAKMMIPLTGMIFAKKMEDILFGENKEEK